jgi:uncharacterized protein YcfL
MKKLLVFPIVALLLLSCKAVPPRLVCNEPMYVVGQVLLAKYSGHETRTVLYKTDNGTMVIYNVPMDAKLDKIPVCIDYHRVVYFTKN